MVEDLLDFIDENDSELPDALVALKTRIDFELIRSQIPFLPEIGALVRRLKVLEARGSIFVPEDDKLFWDNPNLEE